MVPRLLQFAASAFLTVVLLATAGCSRRETTVTLGNRTGVLHVGNGAEVQSLDPHLAGGGDYNVLGALFEGLITLDEETLQPRPGAAERWEISPDGLTYTFYLHPGGKWSNGDPLTARDFLYSFRRALTPSLGSEYTNALYPIRNAEDYARGRLSNFNIVGLRAYDDTTLEIILSRPTPHFITVLRTNVGFPVHTASVESDGAPFDDRTSKWTRATPFVSNGPFRFREWKQHQQLTVEKNPNYWDAASVRLNTITFQPIESAQNQELSFRAGELHTTSDVPVSRIDAYRKDRSGPLRIEPCFESCFLRFNTKHRLFSDVRLRCALALAIDRDAIVKKILRGGQVAATALTPPGLAGYTPPAAVTYDLDGARKLLTESGYPKGKGLPPIQLTTSASEIDRQIAEAIQQMWRRDLGVETQITQNEFKVPLDSFDPPDYAIACGHWTAGYPDPLTYLSILTSRNVANGTGFADPLYDAILVQANAERNPAARLAALQRAESYLLSLMPIAPLFWGSRATLVAPAVRGWKKSPLGFHNYKDVWLEER